MSDENQHSEGGGLVSTALLARRVRSRTDFRGWKAPWGADGFKRPPLRKWIFTKYGEVFNKPLYSADNQVGTPPQTRKPYRVLGLKFTRIKEG